MSKYLLELYENNPSFSDYVEGDVIEVKKNTIIIDKNEKVAFIYIILDGQLRVAANSINMDISPAFSVLGAHDVVGELSLFSGELASAQVTSLSEAKLIRLNKAKVEQFFDENREEGYDFLKDLLKLTSNRLRHSNNKLLEVFAWGLNKNNGSE